MYVSLVGSVLALDDNVLSVGLARVVMTVSTWTTTQTNKASQTHSGLRMYAYFTGRSHASNFIFAFIFGV